MSTGSTALAGQDAATMIEVDVLLTFPTPMSPTTMILIDMFLCFIMWRFVYLACLMRAVRFGYKGSLLLRCPYNSMTKLTHKF
jgi:hypothetical protein